MDHPATSNTTNSKTTSDSWPKMQQSANDRLQKARHQHAGHIALLLISYIKKYVKQNHALVRHALWKSVLEMFLHESHDSLMGN